MSFAVGADAYDRFMGRYSAPLAPPFADFAGVAAGQRVLDVGCGPGALTAELVARLGADGGDGRRSVRDVRRRGARSGTPASTSAARRRRSFRSTTARSTRRWRSSSSTSWRIPSPGCARWRRVTRTGGVVAACVWDHAGGGGPLSPFWEAAHASTPTSATSPARGRARGPSRGAVRGGGAARRRGDPLSVERRARELRGVVGAVHARRRAGRRVRGGPRPRASRPSCASAAANCCRRAVRRRPPAPGRLAAAHDAPGRARRGTGARRHRARRDRRRGRASVPLDRPRAVADAPGAAHGRVLACRDAR